MNTSNIRPNPGIAIRGNIWGWWLITSCSDVGGTTVGHSGLSTKRVWLNQSIPYHPQVSLVKSPMYEMFHMQPRMPTYMVWQQNCTLHCIVKTPLPRLPLVQAGALGNSIHYFPLASATWMSKVSDLDFSLIFEYPLFVLRYELSSSTSKLHNPLFWRSCHCTRKSTEKTAGERIGTRLAFKFINQKNAQATFPLI